MFYTVHHCFTAKVCSWLYAPQEKDIELLLLTPGIIVTFKLIIRRSSWHGILMLIKLVHRSYGFKIIKEALLALSSFKSRMEVRSVLGGTVTWCGAWFFSLIISVVLPSGQIPGTWKWPLWSVTVKSLGLGPARRMAAPGAGRPPALRTDPKTVWSWHMQPLHSSFTLPITHCRSQPKK